MLYILPLVLKTLLSLMKTFLNEKNVLPITKRILFGTIFNLLSFLIERVALEWKQQKRLAGP